MSSVVTDDMIKVKVPVDNVEVVFAFTDDDARKVIAWSPSIVRLNLGQDIGPLVQYSLARFLNDGG